jgi:hypothetical protein
LNTYSLFTYDCRPTGYVVRAEHPAIALAVAKAEGHVAPIIGPAHEDQDYRARLKRAERKAEKFEEQF